jgi:hypothetical protein
MKKIPTFYVLVTKFLSNTLLAKQILAAYPISFTNLQPQYGEENEKWLIKQMLEGSLH